MDSVPQTYRYIVRITGVRGGNAAVEETRVAVHDVIRLFQNGETIESLGQNCLPQLTRAQVYECLAHYEDHRGEIDLLAARQMAPPRNEIPAGSTFLTTSTRADEASSWNRHCDPATHPRGRTRSPFQPDPTGGCVRAYRQH